MTYVLDASVALKWVLNEALRDEAVWFREEARAGSVQLVAPDCFATECAHALTKAARRGLASDPGALWLDLMLDAPALFPSLPLMERAIEIATRARIGVYDCLYVALAEREACELVTADGRLSRNLPTMPIVVIGSS